MERVRAVIFDYGDTLGDLAVAERRLLETYDEIRGLLTTQATLEVPAAADLVQRITVHVMRTVGESYKRHELEELDAVTLFEEALGAIGLVVPRELAQRIHELEYRAIVSERTVPEENLATLEQLRWRGLRLGLVSNAHFLPSLMLEDFERMGLTARIDATVISSQVGVRKPHPEIYRTALAALDVAPQEAVFVGDKMREDVIGPQGLGMRAVLTHQFRQESFEGAGTPDHVVTALPELLGYIDGLLAEA